MPVETKRTLDLNGFDGVRHWPYDTDTERCQCVMGHGDLTEGSVDQCRSARDPQSNRFCGGCENTHGEAVQARKLKAT